MALSTGGSWRRTGQGKVTSKQKRQRAMGLYLLQASAEIAQAVERRDGSKGAASKVRKIEVTPELQARYVRSAG